MDVKQSKSRVWTWICVGYLYIAFVLLVTLVLLGLCLIGVVTGSIKGVLVFKAIVLLSFLGFYVIRSLWVKFDRPLGIEVKRGQAPLLFGIIDDIRLKLNTPPIDCVLVDPVMNAAVVQHPTLGIFGGYKNYLIVGLPLAHALTLEEFKAVLAHEMGHISRAHGRTGAWAYRFEVTWMVIHRNLAGSKDAIFRPFLNWFMPQFERAFSILRRKQEFEADEFAISYTSPHIYAIGLTKLELFGRSWDEDSARAVLSRVKFEEAPPDNYFDLACARLGQLTIGEREQGWIKAAASRASDDTDTHPTLSERLGPCQYKIQEGTLIDGQGKAVAIDFKPGFASRQLFSDELLGNATAKISSNWKQEITPLWKARHAALTEMASRLEALKNKESAAGFTQTELLRIRFLMTELDQGDDAIRPVLKQILALAPGEPGSAYAYGELLLRARQAEGIDWIEKAMEAMPLRYAEHGLRQLAEYYAVVGDEQKSKEAWDRLSQRGGELQQAAAERYNITATDKFLPHDLPEDVIADVRAQIKALGKKVKGAYMVHKPMSHFPQQKLYLLNILLNIPWYRFMTQKKREKLNKEIFDSLNADIVPGDCLIIVDQEFAARAKRVKGAKV